MGNSVGQGWQFWVDRGGTFTDIVAQRPDGEIVVHKLLSENPERYRDAAIQGIREILGIPTHAPLPTEQIAAVKMGTTVATNALLGMCLVWKKAMQAMHGKQKCYNNLPRFSTC